MRIWIGLVALLQALAFGAHAQEADAFPKDEEIVVAERLTIASAILGQDRKISVRLPSSYEDSKYRYPTLYILDSRQNILHALASAEILARTGQIPELIIVGVESEDRDSDYTPSAAARSPNSGGGKRFLDFIAKELIPYVEARYRTHDFAIFEGHSLGGLLAVSAMLERPGLFDAYIVVSPALWWNDEEYIAKSSNLASPAPEPAPALAQTGAAYFGIGEQDGQGMRDELARFVSNLREASGERFRLAHEEFAGEGHMSAPLMATYHGLKHVFADMRIPPSLEQDFSRSAFRAHEESNVAKYGETARQSAETYVLLGFRLEQQGKFDDAIAVFRRNAEAYPGYHRNHAWLASAHEKAGDLNAAVAEYAKALEYSADSGEAQAERYRAEIDRLNALIRSG